MTIVRFFSTDSASSRSSKRFLLVVGSILVFSILGSILVSATDYYLEPQDVNVEFHVFFQGADEIDEIYLSSDSSVVDSPFTDPTFGYCTLYNFDYYSAIVSSGYGYPEDDLDAYQEVTTSVEFFFDGLEDLIGPNENSCDIYFVLYCTNSLENGVDYSFSIDEISANGDLVDSLDGYSLTQVRYDSNTGLTIYRLHLDGLYYDPSDPFSVSLPLHFLNSSVWDSSVVFGLLSSSFLTIVDQNTLPPVSTETAASPSDTEPDFSGTIGNQNQSLIDAQSDANDLLNEIQVDSPDILDIIDNVEGSLDDISALQSIIYPRSSQFYTFVYSLCAIVVSIALLGYILHGNKTG